MGEGMKKVAQESGGQADGVQLIPLPQKYSVRPGRSDLSKPVYYKAPQGLDEQSIRLALGKQIELKPMAGDAEDGLILEFVSSQPTEESSSVEAYKLVVDGKSISITASDEVGFLMGLRTLAQLAVGSPVANCEIIDWPVMDLRAAHVCYCNVRDNTPFNVPDFDALLDHIDALAALKYNALLFEPDGMYPFKDHPDIPCKIAFSREQIAAIGDRLKMHRMELIPLLQSLGHVYYVLTHDKYKSVRETPDKIQQYCATNPESIELFMSFLDDFRSMFPDTKYLHIGGDETWQLGECPRCKSKVEEFGLSRLYVDHIKTVVHKVRQLGITPLLWSDMLEHHGQAREQLRDLVDITYWNYDPANWPRPYFGKEFIDAGFTVVACPAVRSGAEGTDLSLDYMYSLGATESLISTMYKDGCRRVIVTNWAKGSPHEMAHYGFGYAADICWGLAGDLDAYDRRYAKIFFATDDPAICDVYKLLSVCLPYAEPVWRHMPNRLNRLDISGLRFPEQWEIYTSDEKEADTLEKLKKGLEGAVKAGEILADYRSNGDADTRQIELMNTAAQSIEAKARFALALHEGNRLLNNQGDKEDMLRWQRECPAILENWKRAKQVHFNSLVKTGFEPVVRFLNELMFEPAEYDFMVEMDEKIARQIKPA